MLTTNYGLDSNRHGPLDFLAAGGILL